MPTVQITDRYKADEEYARTDYSAHKKAQRKRVLELYPGATDLKQTLITDGIPDWVRLGDLRTKGEIAIRTEFTVSDEVAAEIKKRLK